MHVDAEIFSLPLPLESTWDTLQSTAAVFVFVQRLIIELQTAVDIIWAQACHHHQQQQQSQCGQPCQCEQSDSSGVADEVIQLLKARYELDWRIYQSLLKQSPLGSAGENGNSSSSGGSGSEVNNVAAVSCNLGQG